MSQVTFEIDGMSCNHCVARLRKAIESLPGVLSSDVGIGRATVDADDTRLSRDMLVQAIEGAGYKVK
ncbi:MAG: heavy-metal-associated domain-containing protein [Magnetococcales bacterium]|uniref:Heavy-metal-associated domain-containing protein n=1 Tax=Candidatus Magnetobacterium casense TaxID=1455061 RepID=A0ABS6S2P4_9BACT|nr:cation transporter [Candidatus Magnetobacterium casensis]MBF0608323.1 heavy-metal-associated domain-containing protein [Nitrospirota bacterium]MBV6343111.1 heavy-metal-associated domain-containing protein [Candidatus Magnetobacterium casensis]